MKSFRRSVYLLFLAILLKAWALGVRASEAGGNSLPDHLATNVAQFKRLSAAEYLSKCDFNLTGILTLVDSDRNLLVLQDATGAVGLNYPFGARDFEVGELVSLEGRNCCPSFPRFPPFPHRPSIWNIRDSFKAPINSGQYQLTRMRGFLHPPASGHYTFWIASDNSSELWLSADNLPAQAKRIARVSRFEWVGPHEWTRYPSQRSEPIWLQAGKKYYIEALQEQTVGDANLAVAWQGPNLKREVISGAYLSPWSNGRTISPSQPNGVLLEVWTNFFSGNLAGLAEARPFESVLSVEHLRVSGRAKGNWPKPRRLSLDSKWLPEHNFRWVEVEGVVTFVGEDGESAFLHVPDSNGQVQLRAAPQNSALSQLSRNTRVRVEGVCEGVSDEKGTLRAGLIWILSANNISILELPKSSAIAPPLELSPKTNVSGATVMKGYYGTRGVITFNDRVFGKDWLFVQEGNSVVFVSLKDREARNQLQIGESVELGGELQRGEFLPILNPMVITKLGWQSMPEPITEPVQVPLPPNRDGRWTEIEGVVHCVNSNGTISLMSSREPVCVWLGGTHFSKLNQYVDARLRVRGVLSLAALDAPVLMVPSRSFVEVVTAPAPGPFKTPLRTIALLKGGSSDPAWFHRQRVAGEITWRETHSFLIQDQTGTIRVKPFGNPAVNIGDVVEVAGFPYGPGSIHGLTAALVRPTRGIGNVEPAKLNLTSGQSAQQNGSLVTVEGDLLAQRTTGRSQILELHESQRILTATLSTSNAALPAIAPGSRLRITGIFNSETASSPAEPSGQESVSLASINLWLRSPADVQILSNPPWWTWKRAAFLIGVLFTILTGALSWVHLLRRRLQRQKAAQLAFSQQILVRLEEERRRIAANLHDSLGQVLLAIKNQTTLAMQRTPDEAAVRERLGEISGATSLALDEVRQITHGLRPYQLDRLGLTQAMRATVSGASSASQILFASRVEDIDAVFDKDSEIHVYRIVQEAINNVLKHSAATEAAVVIKNRSSSVSLSIRDNGRGFDVEAMSSSQPNDLGYGLSGIAERVRILSGNWTIDSRPSEGTSLTVEIPVSQPCASKQPY